MSADVVSARKLLHSIYSDICERRKRVQGLADEILRLSRTRRDFYENAGEIYDRLAKLESEISTIFSYEISYGRYRVELEGEEGGRATLYFIPFRRGAMRTFYRGLDELQANFSLLRAILEKVMLIKVNPDLSYMIKKQIAEFDVVFILHQTIADTLKKVDAILSAWQVSISRETQLPQLGVKTRRKT